MAYVSVAHALANALRSGSPERAYQLTPWDGRIAGAYARKLAGPEATQAVRARSDAVARLALRSDPTAVAAVTTLGINAQLRADDVTARRALHHATRLSRRDLVTHLWGIENAVARNDIPSALFHYDTALRTSRSAPDILFPVLISAISDPVIRSALVKRMAEARPDWGPTFLIGAANRNPDPLAISAFFGALESARTPVPQAARSALMWKLFVAGRHQEAWQLYASAHPGASRSRSQDPGFRSEGTDPAPFDWTIHNDAGVATSLQRDEQSSTLHFSTTSGGGGLLLDQHLVLPPGKYRLAGVSAQLEQPPQSQPYWTLACTSGVELLRLQLPNSNIDRGRFGAEFLVPNGCPAQRLSLLARPSNEINGVGGQIRTVEIRPIR
jgi:hypothetical protein